MLGALLELDISYEMASGGGSRAFGGGFGTPMNVTPMDVAPMNVGSIGGGMGSTLVRIDCKDALEVLPTMPWAAQIQKLGLSGTDAEGTMGTFFF